MTEFENKLENALLIVIGVLLAGLFGAAGGILVSQALDWLRTGEIPERDLYWLSADVYCPQGGRGGWEGKDLCRPDFIEFTDWVGLNRILNFIMDMNVAVVAFVLVMVGSFFLGALVGALQNAALARARKRRDTGK